MKPYPWKCRTCRQKAVRPAQVDYQTVVEHDGRKYEVEVPNLSVLRCDDCGALVLGDEGSRAVSAALRQAAGLLTPEQIRGARETLGLTQKQLAEYLGVSEWSLSRWETGAQIQQRAMNTLLDGFFEVPAFRDYLDYPRRAGPESAASQSAANAATLEEFSPFAEGDYPIRLVAWS